MPLDKIHAFIESGDSVYEHRLSDLAKRRAVVEVNDKAVAKAPAAGRKTVKVKSGDTLGAIARRHHTTVAHIKKLNGLRSDALSVGQTLRVK